MKYPLRLLLGSVALVGTATAFQMRMSAPSSPSATAVTSDRRSFLQTGAATAAAVGVGAVAPPAAIADDADPYADYTTTESGIKFKITKEGTGGVPEPGQTLKTQYTGWLDGFDSPKKFDSSRDRGRPFTFKAGAGQVSEKVG